MNADLIVMYHSVVPDEAAVDDWLHVPVSRFEAQLRFLLRGFEPVTPEAFFAPAPGIRPRLLVTFDDGYANNAAVAYPVLQRLRVPALFFLAIGYLDEPWFWWDRLREGLRLVGKTPRREDYAAIKALPPRAVAAAVDAHLHQAGAPLQPEALPWMRPLTWEEAQGFARAEGVFIGNHGDRHEIFARLNDTELALVLSRTQRLLALRLGVETPWLAPPNGEWRSEQADVFVRSGLRYVFGTQPGWVRRGPRGVDGRSASLVVLPRLGVGAEDTPWQLLRRLLKTYWRPESPARAPANS